MITIKIGDTPLYIPKETTLVLEQHNNSFDIDNLTSDIIWTFDVPAAPNAIALNNAHFVYISNFKRYRCTIIFNGIVISNGYLFVQSVVDEKKISCGVVLDGLGEEFANRKLKDNNYGDDVVISQLTDNLETHRANWLSFLYESLTDNSIYKFFLFTCESFYKNNDAYGYHQDKWSTLQNEHDEKTLWAKYVNRLITYRQPQQPAIKRILNQADSIEQGVKLFNTLGNNTDKLNGYTFAPAIRLDWLVRKVFANAGYRVTGDFLPNDFIKKLYLQSMNAMDGDMTQFGRDEYLYLTGGAVGQDITNAPQYTLDVGVNEVTYNSFKHGGSAATFNFGIRADVDSLTHEQVTSSIYEYVDEVFFLWAAPSDTQISSGFPYTRCCVSSIFGAKDFRYGGWPYFSNLRDAAAAAGYPQWGGSAVSIKLRFEDNGRFYGIDNFRNLVNNADYYYDLEAKETLIQLTPSHDNSGANYDDPEQLYDIKGNFLATRFFQMGNATNPFCIRLVKAKVKSTKHTQWTGNWDDTPNATMNINGIGAVPVWIPKEAQLEFLEYEETIEKTDLNNTNTMMNVFDTMLRWKQHVPNVSNGDFIKKICRFFGLSMYINPFHKVVQLSFANNLFSAKATDISEYVINTERMTFEPKQYQVAVDTVLSTKGVAEDFLMEDVVKRSDLEVARSKKRMSVFVANENAYNIATQDEGSGKYTWKTSAGNDKKMIVGNNGDDVEDVSTEIQVPNMRVVDTQGAAKYFCDIATSGNSKLMDDDYTGEFDMILMQYKGQRFVNLKPGGMSYPCYIEDANPTCMDKDGVVNEDYLDLAAVGKNAVGEKWLRKLYEFKATQERYRFVAKLPVQVFLAIYQMQMPQEESKGSDTRWIMVRNRKYMPLTISYEFGANNKVLATIECARMHY
jgi:hypothetical protein